MIEGFAISLFGFLAYLSCDYLDDFKAGNYRKYPILLATITTFPISLTREFFYETSFYPILIIAIILGGLLCTYLVYWQKKEIIGNIKD